MHEVLIEEKILSKNIELAAENRGLLKANSVFAINLVSSPGSGKTTLIEKTAPFFKKLGLPFAVIEGDQQTDLDSRRIAKLGIPVKQITTGRACHLDAHLVGHHLPWVFGQGVRLLIIENVGNMVCPAEYDLGEDAMITVMSVAEGDDKPLKYPAIFAKSDVLVINKTDLLGSTDFDMAAARKNALAINPYLKIFEVSCRSGAGLGEWCAFVAGLVEAGPKK